ncbi:MAG TPA: polysaccharide biosynthesis/export family protein [Stellaceae bacterium]|jgi:polysaccharide export outer membrane protein|nr:polysaccharide biosynthesis/export family protein [Stellaceae bacterium]
MRKSSAASICAVWLLTVLSACNYLPSSGPTADALLDSAKNNNLNIKVIDVTPSVIGVLATQPTESMAGLQRPGAVPAVDRIGIGDVLSISIFQAGGPMLPPSGSGDPAAPSGSAPSIVRNSLPNIVVDSRGVINIPYVGRVQAAGVTPIELQDQIVQRLKNKAIEPQVVVTIAANVANTVVVSGDVKAPGRMPLSLAHETILDMVAASGGALHAPQDIVARLSRASVQRSVRLSRIDAVSAENIYLAPGDRLELLYQPRSFTAFGATGKVSEVPFESNDVTLADAIARTGGPFEQTADPSGVYLFRFEQPATARQLGLPPAQSEPVIYHVDLREAQSYFAMQKFDMRSGDVIFIASAKTDSMQKFFNLINALFSPAIVTKTLAQ